MTSLWDIQQYDDLSKNSFRKSKDILFYGGKQAGKSALINAYLGNHENPQSTSALEYHFKTINDNESLQLWELGGGLDNISLLDIPISPDNLLDLTIVVVLDLSDAKTIWVIIDLIIKEIEQRLKKMFSRLVKEHETELKSKLKDRLNLRCNPSDNQDSPLLNPFPIPLVFIGNKFDKFLLLPKGDQELIENTLRFLSLHLGASLYFSSCNPENANFVALKVTEAIIKGPLKSSIEFTSSKSAKPVYIPFGTEKEALLDLLAKIDPHFNRSSEDYLKQAVQAFTSRFPQATVEKLTTTGDTVAQLLYNETLIDRLRQKYDEEFEGLRKLAKVKFKSDVQQAYGNGFHFV